MLSWDPIQVSTPLPKEVLEPEVSPIAEAVQSVASPQAGPSPLGRWDLRDKAPGPKPDVWCEGREQEIVDEVVQKGKALGLDVAANPRILLEYPDLVNVLFPGTEEFMKPTEVWAEDIRDFVSKLVACGDEFGFAEALELVESSGLGQFTERALVSVIEFVGTSVAIDAICLDGALSTVFAYFVGVDHRIQDGSMRCCVVGGCRVVV